MIYIGVKLSIPDAQVGGYDKYFHSTPYATSYDHDTDPHPEFNYINITENEVTGVLQKPNVNKSCGPDDVSPVGLLLKSFSFCLAPSVTYVTFLIDLCKMVLCQPNSYEQMYSHFIKARVTKTVQAITDNQYLFCLLLVT